MKTKKYSRIAYHLAQAIIGVCIILIIIAPFFPEYMTTIYFFVVIPFAIASVPVLYRDIVLAGSLDNKKSSTKSKN